MGDSITRAGTRVSHSDAMSSRQSTCARGTKNANPSPANAVSRCALARKEPCLRALLGQLGLDADLLDHGLRVPAERHLNQAEPARTTPTPTPPATSAGVGAGRARAGRRDRPGGQQDRRRRLGKDGLRVRRVGDVAQRRVANVDGDVVELGPLVFADPRELPRPEASTTTHKPVRYTGRGVAANAWAATSPHLEVGQAQRVAPRLHVRDEVRILFQPNVGVGDARDQVHGVRVALAQRACGAPAPIGAETVQPWRGLGSRGDQTRSHRAGQ